VPAYQLLELAGRPNILFLIKDWRCKDNEGPFQPRGSGLWFSREADNSELFFLDRSRIIIMIRA
jgi:hypothetical protein